MRRLTWVFLILALGAFIWACATYTFTLDDRREANKEALESLCHQQQAFRVAQIEEARGNAQALIDFVVVSNRRDKVPAAETQRTIDRGREYVLFQVEAAEKRLPEIHCKAPRVLE